MSESELEQTPLQKKIAELKGKYGDLVVIEIEEKTLAFKRLSRAQLTDLKQRLVKQPNLVIELTINACEFNCVLGGEHFKLLADRYPLAFCGNEDSKGVIDVLMDLARGGAQGPNIRVE